ncbi:MAG: hypothetical protein NVS3B1_21330 [Marmoricola sp.]
MDYTEKKCTKCQTVKPLEDFHLLKTMRDGRASWCKACAGASANRLMREMRERVVRELGGVCVAEGCGITDVRILTIDHVGGGGNVHRKTSGGYPYYKAMLADLDSFQVLCWNHNHLKRLDQGEHRKPLPHIALM